MADDAFMGTMVARSPLIHFPRLPDADATVTIHNLGSINIDHVYRVPHLVRPGETLSSRALETVLGGKGANQSVAAARAGAAVRHIGRLGEADTWARDILSEAGVDVSGIELIDGASGHAIIQVDDGGENAIVLHGGANLGFDAETVAAALAPAVAGDWLLLQNETSGIADAFAFAIERGLRIAFNPAPMRADVAELPLEQCDTLILNETEAAMLAGVAGGDDAADGADNDGAIEEAAIERELVARYPDVRIVLTLGAAGARLLQGGTRLSVEAPRVEAVDTTGAGDTFVGYLLAALVDDQDAEAALRRACAAGALSVMRAGATPSIPTAAAVDEFLTTER